MTNDYEFFNDEWNEAYIKKSNTQLSRVEGSIEDASATEE